MAEENSDDYDHFVELHNLQLNFSGVPEHFWPALQRKLKSEVFDAGNYFSMVCQHMDDDDASSDEGSADDSFKMKKSSDTEPPKKKLTPASSLDHECRVASPATALRGLGTVGKRMIGEKWKVLVSNENGVDMKDLDCIFLIDHAWTYTANEARGHLSRVPGLLNRMVNLMDIDPEGMSEEEQIQLVLHRMWRYNQTYSIQSPDLAVEDKMPVWYVMDEFGSRIGHSDDPNMRTVPFYHVSEGVSYTLMFPIKNLNVGDTVTRDYIEGALYHHPEWRSFYLIPWNYANYSHLPYDFMVPDDSFFTQDRNDERLLDSPIHQPKGDGFKLNVYSEYSKVRDHLKHGKFQIIDDQDEADVLWLHQHFKDFKSLIEQRPSVMINQIPFESVLTVKDLLAAAVHSWSAKRAKSSGDISPIDQNTLESQPHWLATTYNLRTELPQFVSYYQNREKLGMDNHWIIKPWNLARGLDTTVTSDLCQIIRLIGSGPKIACKYLEDPVLFHRDDIDAWVKFDMRFIVLLKSVKPMRLYVYDRFWLRFALKPFSMDTLDDYEKHFTVFNYLDSSKIKQMFSKDFVEQFHRQYPQCNWDDVLKRMYDSFKELFEIACSEKPPRGLAPYPQCRAMYGLDVMLRWADNEKGEKIMQPIILEVNFMPDCERACDYYPDFMDTIFETLFLDEVGKDLPVTLF